MVKTLYVPDTLQYSDFDCGAACVQGIIAYYGQDLNEIKLLKKLKTNKSDGTGSDHIIKFFENKGYKVEARSMDIEDLISFIKKKIPVIVLAQAWKNSKVRYRRTKASGHYLIVIGYDDKNLYFKDHAMFGKGYIPRKEFLKRWHAEDRKNEILTRYGIAVWGKKPFNYNKFTRIK